MGQGDPCRAARQAFLIASGLMFRGDIAPAQGWLSRAGRVLEGMLRERATIDGTAVLTAPLDIGVGTK